ncbi:hypothetical protein [Cecembia calidifontis]|uniref:Uncharacterized protein n=1 Tax=Cecembia calidifontis TaxID=1187080 RepID=A0A4Q7P6X6_9BACT|nr:hypothetical protein [Cecembia calidifontis]RZS95755.1 hypothetical protein BC751_1296 [Cecembia calidifontis]
MRKISAILLLCCFALYHFGYYVAYFSFHIQIENNWADKIYSDQQEGWEERILEIPMSLPYMPDEEDFRTTNTRFEKNGQYFRAIKQRYVKDTLQIFYVPDTAKSNLDKTIKQWVSSLVQDDLPDSGNNSLLSKIFVKDYTQPFNDFHFDNPFKAEKQLIGFIFSAYQNQFPEVNSPPPQVI